MLAPWHLLSRGEGAAMLKCSFGFASEFIPLLHDDPLVPHEQVKSPSRNSSSIADSSPFSSNVFSEKHTIFVCFIPSFDMLMFQHVLNALC